eukprot:gene4200-4505_t
MGSCVGVQAAPAGPCLCGEGVLMAWCNACCHRARRLPWIPDPDAASDAVKASPTSVPATVPPPSCRRFACPNPLRAPAPA